MNAVVLWSGGKDSCCAACRARGQGVTLAALLRFQNTEKPTLPHGVNHELITRQMALTGIPSVNLATTAATFAGDLHKTLRRLKREYKVDAMVAGVLGERSDMRTFVDTVCNDGELTPVLPLLGIDTAAYASSLAGEGVKAIVSAVNLDYLAASWLGREIDRKFFKDLKQCERKIDPAAVNGEYHSLVLDSPLFSAPLNVVRDDTLIRCPEKKHFLALQLTAGVS